MILNKFKQKLKQILVITKILNSNADYYIKYEVLKLFLVIYFKLHNSYYVKFLNRKLYFRDINTCFDLICEIFIQNEYHVNIINNDSDSFHILDIGSNIGISVIYFKYMFPNASIDCYEPSIDSFKCLEKNIISFCLKNTFAHNTAIASKYGQIEFYIDNKSSASTTSSTSKLAIFEEVSIVNCVPLSSCINRNINILKMDIEGAEEEAISELFLSNKISFLNYLIIEYHHHHGLKPENNLSQFLNYFEKNGFGYLLEANFNNLHLLEYKNITQNIKLIIYKNEI